MEEAYEQELVIRPGLAYKEGEIPSPAYSVIVAVAVSLLVGIIFGTAPAAHAAQMDPIESLYYE